MGEGEAHLKKPAGVTVVTVDIEKSELCRAVGGTDIPVGGRSSPEEGAVAAACPLPGSPGPALRLRLLA